MAASLKYTAKLVNQRVLVLGGTSGIGYCVVEAALEHGCNVVISSSNKAKLDNTVARLREAYPTQYDKQSITTHVCDLADAATLDANLEALFQAATNGGTVKLNHVVFTAGDALKLPPLSEVTPEVIHRNMNVRFVAPAVMAKYIAKYVELSPASSFTMTGGVAAHKPLPGWSMASAATSAIEGLARGLAVDLKPVRVNVVSPGAVHTELFSMFPKEGLESILQQFRDRSTTGTVAKPEDLAESYIYIMKDHFVTGVVIDSSGGALLI
ncbi:NAD(P)-binding protein [Penicillium hispanicum]|uniref:NAD(P)-binding protein n=1 Tax=Penicillium hispanicum TaxID=1080232 RepID=UPI002540CA57|nr:NAD(P)-binding protein [Penicillium hispanicum]KAJ5584346.1 NAD(P)-binding protein [Penicillium hispanicum]